MPITNLSKEVQEACHQIGQQMARDRPDVQFQRVGLAWEECLKSPGDGTMGRIVRRVFTALRYGGLMFRSSRASPHWEWWRGRNWPIACALGHGGRVLIQLPIADVNSPDYSEASQHDDGFWNWLTERGRYPVATRIAATHGLSVLPDPQPLPGRGYKVLKEEASDYVVDQHNKGDGKSKRTGGAERLIYLIALEKARLEPLRRRGA